MGTEHSLGQRASASPLDIWTAHFGLFAQCLTFVQPFNSLHWLECKHRPAAEAVSLGRHPAIHSLGLLGDGSRCSQHCGRIFSTSLFATPPIPAPVHVGGTGSSELETSWRSGYKMLSGSSMKNFSVDFSYLTHSNLTFNLRKK